MKTRVFQLGSTSSYLLFSAIWRPVLVFLVLWSSVALVAFGQTKEWDKTFGGSESDFISFLHQTSDGGYILGGTSDSPLSGDKTEASRGLLDYWVVKLDADGQKEWDKTFGGNGDDIISSLQQTSDGGYILGGRSDSPISGDKTEDSRGGEDYWVIKLDAAGQMEWDKTFGGNEEDILQSLQQTSDRGYILGGWSNSGANGDKTEANKGICEDSNCFYDYWVVKLDAAGQKEWDKTFGGSDNDYLNSLQHTSDGGYILGGESGSDISGDKTEDSRESSDYWIVKLDASGQKQWDKTFGGNFEDILQSLQQTNDGGYVLGGWSLSDVSGDKTENHRGGVDYWVVKLNATGQKEWDKTVGGNDEDNLFSLQQTSDGGYILGGASISPASGDKTEERRGVCEQGLCPSDYWVVKLNAAGQKEWDKTIGGNFNDLLLSLQQTADGGYILGGWSDSDANGDKSEDSKGGSDFWVVKLKGEAIPTCQLALTSQVTQAEPWYGMWGALQGAGAINLTVAGGTAPYTYLWNSGAATEDLSLASPGTYSVVVTDANGCVGRTTVYVGKKNGFLRVLSSHTNVSIVGGSDGAIDLTVVGGGVPATFLWSNGATTEDLTGLATGTYTVVVTDAFGRQATTTVIISQPGTPLSLVIAHQNVSAAGKQDGAVDLTVVGGIGPYTYQWNTGAVTEDLNQASLGNYRVTVTDATGTTATASVRVGVGRSPILTARKTAAQENLLAPAAGLTVYPNPVINKATVSFSLAAPGKYSLDLYDIRGAKVKTLTSGKAQAGKALEAKVNVAEYATGVYLLKLVTDKGVSTSRLMIQR